MKNMLQAILFKAIFGLSRCFWRRWALYQLRDACFDPKTLVIGPDVCSRFTFHHAQQISLGEATVLNGNMYINAAGGVSIGCYCHVAQGLTLYTSSHNWRSLQAVPYAGPDVLQAVRIGNAVWIGANVTILPGADIGDGAIIAAGAVVRGLVPDGALMAGNPAVIVAERDMVTFKHLYEMGACL